MSKSDETELLNALETWQLEQGGVLQEPSGFMPKTFHWFALAPFVALIWAVSFIAAEGISYVAYREYIDQSTWFDYLVAIITTDSPVWLYSSLAITVCIGLLVGWFTRGKLLGVFIVSFMVVRYFVATIFTRPLMSYVDTDLTVLDVFMQGGYGPGMAAWWDQFLFWMEIQFEDPVSFLYFLADIIITIILMKLYASVMNKLGGSA